MNQQNSSIGAQTGRLSGREIFVLWTGIALALFLRYNLRGFETPDYQFYTGSWYDFILANGGFQALKFPFSNYTPPYLYLMVIATYVFSGVPKIFAIKLISITFDLIAAFLVYLIVRLRFPQGWVPVFAVVAFLFLPTVVINSSLWGQADIIYTTGLLVCVYFLLTDRPIPAMIAFGIAISFKLQAIFLLPFLLLLFFKKKIPLWSVLLVTGMYLIMMLPAWAAGRPLSELLTIYLQQGETYTELTMNAPNLYQWISNAFYDVGVPFGFVLTGIIVAIFVSFVHVHRDQIYPAGLVHLALLSTLIMPFFLPKMHDRYFFPADVFALLFGFYYPEWFLIPIAVQFVSLFSYFPFLFGKEVVSLSWLAGIQLANILILVFIFVKTPSERPRKMLP